MNPAHQWVAVRRSGNNCEKELCRPTGSLEICEHVTIRRKRDVDKSNLEHAKFCMSTAKTTMRMSGIKSRRETIMWLERLVCFWLVLVVCCASTDANTKEEGSSSLAQRQSLETSNELGDTVKHHIHTSDLDADVQSNRSSSEGDATTTVALHLDDVVHQTGTHRNLQQDSIFNKLGQQVAAVSNGAAISRLAWPHTVDRGNVNKGGNNNRVNEIPVNNIRVSVVENRVKNNIFIRWNGYNVGSREGPKEAKGKDGKFQGKIWSKGSNAIKGSKDKKWNKAKKGVKDPKGPSGKNDWGFNAGKGGGAFAKAAYKVKGEAKGANKFKRGTPKVKGSSKHRRMRMMMMMHRPTRPIAQPIGIAPIGQPAQQPAQQPARRPTRNPTFVTGAPIGPDTIIPTTAPTPTVASPTVPGVPSTSAPTGAPATGPIPTGAPAVGSSPPSAGTDTIVPTKAPSLDSLTPVSASPSAPTT
ncbi:hypothetical protein MPSEU_000336500 [Mayamaea pseudoterrestris]|nr:hypothetical protein MPSEU_000336500 [Mayamaea pseudoterrestris]